MISNALQFTRDALDQYLKNLFGLGESKVLLNKLIENNGDVPPGNQNKVLITLINIEKETLKPFYQRNQKNDNGGYSNMSTSERYNLFILISANFDDYTEGLQFLNACMQFFQVNQAIDSNSYSGMPADVGRLEYDIEKITYHQMHGLWTSMGARYLPSVVYKTRLLTIQEGESYSFTSPVTSTSNSATA
ncbi:MAG TPA: DUF4255 domain-containing protein [Bacteroidia bacterium]|nr:DUF4255 domain-containing protein [Bacteroidia bacterium]